MIHRKATQEFTHRFTVYARSKGLQPEECLRQDTAEYGGEYDPEQEYTANMLNFMIWIQEQWAEWKELRGIKKVNGMEPALFDSDHADFDNWIGEKYPCN